LAIPLASLYSLEFSEKQAEMSYHDNGIYQHFRHFFDIGMIGRCYHTYLISTLGKQAAAAAHIRTSLGLLNFWVKIGLGTVQNYDIKQTPRSLGLLNFWVKIGLVTVQNYDIKQTPRITGLCSLWAGPEFS
jgi:hypothetical protein